MNGTRIVTAYIAAVVTLSLVLQVRWASVLQVISPW